MDLVAKWYMHVGKTRFTGCGLEEKIEGKLRGHGETDTKYRFCIQSIDFVKHYNEFAWFVHPVGPMGSPEQIKNDVSSKKK